MSKSNGLGYDSAIVWNFPIDIKFKSTNPYGWPRIAVSVSISTPHQPPPHLTERNMYRFTAPISSAEIYRMVMVLSWFPSRLDSIA